MIVLLAETSVMPLPLQDEVWVTVPPDCLGMATLPGQMGLLTSSGVFILDLSLALCTCQSRLALSNKDGDVGVCGTTVSTGQSR